MKKLASTLFVLLGALGTAQAQVQGDATAGQAKAVTCVACHNADGNSTMPIWPKLAGQHADYLAKQLADYKSGARQDATMNGMAAPLSDQDIADLAAWFSSQTMSIGSAPEGDLTARGEAIYRGGIREKGIAACMSCHGPRGEGNPGAGFARLGGQHPQYVTEEMKAFRSGERSNDLANMMQDVANRMTDAEIEAVAAYISGLH